MAKRVRMFFAYPSEPASLPDIVRLFVEEARQHKGVPRELRIQTWDDSQVSGQRLASTIMNNIRRSPIFACDLTYLNNNVAFELGYAIGTFKRLFISLDTSIQGSERTFKNSFFQLLGMGYSGYRNHAELVELFAAERPWDGLDKTILGQEYRNERPRPEAPRLLYVKPPINTPQVVKVVETLQRSDFARELVVDDPRDNAGSRPEWYADQIKSSDATIVQLLSNNNVGSSEHNIKASVVAGLALGLGCRVLMLAQAPFESPVDYTELLQVHQGPSETTPRVNEWLTNIIAELPARRPRRPVNPPASALELRHVSMGQYVAEFERDEIDDYFVETSSYLRALDDQSTIIVGRRGTGKTAILHTIRMNRESARSDHVTVIDPVGYELEGLVRILGEIREIAERGFLIESLWKYLIYSEIAQSIEQRITNRSAYTGRTEEEEQFLQFCESNAVRIREPFSSRLEHAVRSLTGVGPQMGAVETRARISEGLHDGMLNVLRRHIGQALGGTTRLTVLVDRLDEPWEPGTHIDELTDLISGLLHVVQDIPRDLGRSGHGLIQIPTQMTVFLRSDIFAFVQPRMREQDKLPLERLNWHDRELLSQVIVQRILRRAPVGFAPDTVWTNLFSPEIVGVSPEEFVLRSVMPRPRDAIYFVRQAVNNAINRGHEIITQEDLLDARSEYSEFAFRSILKEDDPQRNRLEAVLYEFAGAPRIVEQDDLQHRMNQAGVHGDDVDYYIDLLCDIGFLGIQSRDGFEFPADEGRRALLRSVTKRIVKNRGSVEQFEINPAFYSVLQID